MYEPTMKEKGHESERARGLCMSGVEERKEKEGNDITILYFLKNLKYSIFKRQINFLYSSSPKRLPAALGLSPAPLLVLWL